MSLFGLSTRAWRIWGLVNGGFAGLFYLTYEVIGIVSPSLTLLMLENLILSGLFGGLAAICVFIAETPHRTAQDRGQTSQQESTMESSQDVGTSSQDGEEAVELEES
ncbi:hypothetical protein [Halobaculum gomorrense]|uniref:hypothetical protein n=1 Tax=Halobaculum gomorrense TaxID=43928 RepID=UPI0011611AC3|nr:hypothetical protein [Halobaculum gomorrense]